MKKLIFVFAIFIMVLIGCQRDLIKSDMPNMFIIQEMQQTAYEKHNNVAEYRVKVWTTNNSLSMNNLWFTLKEGFQVGDTLDFVKVSKK